MVGRAESLQKAWVGLGMQAKEASNVEPSALGQSVMGWNGRPRADSVQQGALPCRVRGRNLVSASAARAATVSESISWHLMISPGGGKVAAAGVRCQESEAAGRTRQDRGQVA